MVLAADVNGVSADYECVCFDKHKERAQYFGILQEEIRSIAPVCYVIAAFICCCRP